VNGRPGHEFVQVYDAEFMDQKFYKMELIEGYEANGSELKVIWKDIAFFQNGEAPLFPNGLLELLEKNNSRYVFQPQS
jgi:hypothetical protein